MDLGPTERVLALCARPLLFHWLVARASVVAPPSSRAKLTWASPVPRWPARLHLRWLARLLVALARGEAAGLLGRGANEVAERRGRANEVLEARLVARLALARVQQTHVLRPNGTARLHLKLALRSRLAPLSVLSLAGGVLIGCWPEIVAGEIVCRGERVRLVSEFALPSRRRSEVALARYARGRGARQVGKAAAVRHRSFSLEAQEADCHSGRQISPPPLSAWPLNVAAAARLVMLLRASIIETNDISRLARQGNWAAFDFSEPSHCSGGQLGAKLRSPPKLANQRNVQPQERTYLTQNGPRLGGPASGGRQLSARSR